MDSTLAPTALPTSTFALARPRAVERLVQGQATSDGAGVKLVRLLTQDLQRRLDPFLMLDAFGTDRADDYIAGFPDHPHRGFETITVMLQGRMRHRDSRGNEGLLVPGAVQWMTAGRGLIHSEMPEQEDGAMEGFQLWLNLPARSKMQTPAYRDLAPAQIPHWQGEGAHVRVIAGACHGVSGAVQRDDTEPLLLDITLAAGARFEQPLPPGHNAFVVAYRGALEVLGSDARTPVSSHGKAVMAILGSPKADFRIGASNSDAAPDGVRLHAGPEGASLLLVAGRPLREPIAQYGPFVMNTQAELVQAVEDFRAGTLA
jgi:quercetin 2,3-dioxygenase